MRPNDRGRSRTSGASPHETGDDMAPFWTPGALQRNVVRPELFPPPATAHAPDPTARPWPGPTNPMSRGRTR